MDKLNINILFPSNRTNDKPLDVNNIYSQQTKKKGPNLSVDGLLSRKEERKRKTIESYKKVYNMVLNKISTSNKINDTTEIIYDVPESIFGCKDYTSTTCLEYIESKLRNIYFMDTLKLSHKSIFISWKNIEDNRKKTQITPK